MSVVCGTVWSGYGGVNVCCVLDSFVWVWGSECVFCVWESLEWVWGSECVLCVGQYGVGMGE